MGRRCRHISHKALGAAVAYDTRRLAGGNGDAISTMADLTGNGLTATQSTSGLQPLLQTGGNGINGSTVLLFDGSNDFMSHSYALPASGANASIFAVAQALSSTFGYRPVFSCSPPFNIITLQINIQFGASAEWYCGSSGTATGISSASAPAVVMLMREAGSGVLTTDVRGIRASASSTPFGGDASTRQAIGAGVTSLEEANIKLGSIVAFNSILSGPMQRRVSHLLSLSFKIPYS
jgi:hypothetical protein